MGCGHSAGFLSTYIRAYTRAAAERCKPLRHAYIARGSAAAALVSSPVLEGFVALFALLAQAFRTVPAFGPAVVKPRAAAVVIYYNCFFTSQGCAGKGNCYRN